MFYKETKYGSSGRCIWSWIKRMSFGLGKWNKTGIYNSNNSNQGLGYNQFNVTSADNFFNNETNDIMLAQGCSEAGSQYAKQFSIQNNLRRLGEWYQYTNARPGDIVRVSWLNSTDITLELIHN